MKQTVIQQLIAHRQWIQEKPVKQSEKELVFPSITFEFDHESANELKTKCPEVDFVCWKEYEQRHTSADVWVCRFRLNNEYYNVSFTRDQEEHEKMVYLQLDHIKISGFYHDLPFMNDERFISFSRIVETIKDHYRESPARRLYFATGEYDFEEE